MKALKNIVYFTIMIMIFSCSSSERIITEDGKIYIVNGDKIKKNGKEINNDLSSSEKENIYELLNQKRAIKEEQEKKIQDLENAIKEQEKIEKEAKEKQRELKNQLDDFNDNINKRQDLRDDFVKVKRNFNAQKRKYKRLKKNGNLSEIELKEWELKLIKLKEDVVKAKLKI